MSKRTDHATDASLHGIVIGRFEALANRGYHVNVVFTGDTVECTHISGGDPNCPHPKYFDPSDGHGWTYVHMDHVPDEVLDELDDGRSSQEFCDGLFDWMEKHVLNVEAKAR